MIFKYLYKIITWCGIALMCACSPSPQSTLITITGKTMGTSYTVKYLAPADKTLPEATQIQAQLNDLLNEINRQMSTYQPDSEISRFNQMGANQTMEISDDFAAVLNEAIRLNHITQGALDVTIGPLVNLWGFGADKTVQNEPNAEQLSAIKRITGLDKIVFRLPEDGKKAQLNKTIDGVYLDLSAIAKGFGVDKLAWHLDSLGVADYLVEIGGELRAKGHNAQGQAWQVGIEQPDLTQHRSQIIIALPDLALATSGDYRHFRLDQQGQRISHLIDPKTQRPIQHRLASVSVIAQNAMTADGLATGLYVLGENEALRVAEENQLAVMLIVQTDAGFVSKMSSKFNELLSKKGQP